MSTAAMQSCLKGREEFLKSTVSKSAFKNAYNSKRENCAESHMELKEIFEDLHNLPFSV